MTRALPRKETRSYALLIALQQGPGTFYQVCERAGFDIEQPGVESRLRPIFATMIGGHAQQHGIMYSLTDEAREAFGIVPPAPPPYVGQVAGPAFRGEHHPTTVFITRRPKEGARA
ncbi:hypothetical protein [Duganella callida]|uniref:Uncharacterized protein n=1 Tax=Duganella callida TaxID=2561932 RepID=A0A4Y9S3L1_9BURK|nr:hypothetical protein [Duganella callida]TFW15938.1 hypothetical protein E4L98_24905 [Duganella callida]